MSAPATPALCRQIAFFALGPLLCFSLKDLPPLEGMNPDGMVCLAGCAWLMLWWMTEVLPLPVTSLMAVPIFGFLGVMAPDKVFAKEGGTLQWTFHAGKIEVQIGSGTPELE